MIRSGSVSLQVKSAPEAMQAVREMAAKVGGLVANEDLASSSQPGYTFGSITVAVPAETLSEFVDEV